MASKGFAPNVRSYTSVIDACSKAGDTQRALSIYSAMKARGIAPSEITYSILARGFAKAGDFKKVEEICEMFYADGFPLNSYMFGILLSAYANSPSQKKEKQRAESLFRQAMAIQIQLDHFALGSLDRILGKQQASALLHELAIERPQRSYGR